MTNAGWLRHRITIQDKSVARNAYGEEVITWTEVATVWAAVWPIRGREYMEAQQQQADVTHRVMIRYRTDVVPTMRITWGSRTFMIESVIEVRSARRDMELICRELVES